MQSLIHIDLSSMRVRLAIHIKKEIVTSGECIESKKSYFFECFSIVNGRSLRRAELL